LNRHVGSGAASSVIEGRLDVVYGELQDLGTEKEEAEI